MQAFYGGRPCYIAPGHSQAGGRYENKRGEAQRQEGQGDGEAAHHEAHCDEGAHKEIAEARHQKGSQVRGKGKVEVQAGAHEKGWRNNPPAGPATEATTAARR